VGGAGANDMSEVLSGASCRLRKSLSLVSVDCHGQAKKVENVVALPFFPGGYDEKGRKRRTMKRKKRSRESGRAVTAPQETTQETMGGAGAEGKD
jgi:hypothetical protein